MAEQFVSILLEELATGEELPATLYLYLDYRFIVFRGAGDILDRQTYTRLEIRKVKNLFINDKDRQVWSGWVKKRQTELKPTPGLRAEPKPIQKVRDDLHRKTMDIFNSNPTDKAVQQTMTASRRLVTEVMKSPLVVKSLTQLQTYSQGTVDHSVNVSVLGVYLALQIGYSHAQILQHVGLGGLLHDVGKTKVQIGDSDTAKEIDGKLRDHPALGAKVLDGLAKVPNEVRLIVAQHHECHDGSGFPNRLRGPGIYDLAKIVSIANVFDELVSGGQGSLVDRQRAAIQQLDKVLYKKFDPVKLEKALRVLKLGI